MWPTIVNTLMLAGGLTFKCNYWNTYRYLAIFFQLENGN